jgi:hypothetical protein
VGRHHHAIAVRTYGLDALQEFHSVCFSEIDVDQGQLNLGATQNIFGLVCVACSMTRVAFGVQHRAEPLACGLIVVNDQDFYGHDFSRETSLARSTPKST